VHTCHVRFIVAKPEQKKIKINWEIFLYFFLFDIGCLPKQKQPWGFMKLFKKSMCMIVYRYKAKITNNKEEKNKQIKKIKTMK